MEPVTHLLTGGCLGRTGFNRRSALATATMVIAAEIPDLDVLWYFKNPVWGFAHHRGFTHSLIGVPFDAALALGIIFIYWKLRGEKRMAKKLAGRAPDAWEAPRWGMLYLFACIATLSHLLLDFTNNYGLRPFAPWNTHWYAWDIVFIIEPLLLAALIIGLTAPALFRLVGDEVASRRAQSRRVPGGRGGAIFALVFMVLLWGYRDQQHRRALAALNSLTYRDEIPLRVSAYPEWVNPYQWHGVVETKDFFALMPVDSQSGEVDPQGQMQVLYKPEETPVTLAAKRSYLGRVILDWARYPMVEVEEHPADASDMYTVEIFDLRFANISRKRRPLGGVVELDKNLHVVDEYMNRGGGRK